MIVEKYIKDGKVAVLYSAGYGAGWSTWNYDHDQEFLTMDRQLCIAVEANDFESFNRRIADVFKIEGVCTLGVPDIKIAWVKLGESFRINEYDGFESVVLQGETKWLTA